MTKGSTSVKLGIIGCGWVTETFHLPALQRVKAAHVAALADHDPDRLNRVAERFRVRRRYSDYLAMLDEPGIEAVGVWLPDERQVEAAQAVLAAGKHLIIEKPLLLDMIVWDKLIEQAGNAGRNILVVGLSRRWHRHVQRAREVIEKGKLGRIEFIRTTLTGRNPEHRALSPEGDRHAANGIIYHFGMQHFDTLQALVPGEVQEIHAISDLGESTAIITARLTDGVMVSFTFSEGTILNDEIEICGQAGRVRVSFHRFDGFEYFPSDVFPGDLKTRVGQLFQSLKQVPQGLLQIRHGGGFVDSYRKGWQHCIDAICRGARPDCTLVEARRAMHFVLAAKESVERGKTVTVSEPDRNRV